MRARREPKKKLRNPSERRPVRQGGSDRSDGVRFHAMSPTTSDAALHGSVLRDRLVDSIENKKLELPILPGAASQVLSLCGDATADVKKLAGLIQSDQALAGHVLRVANSAAYAPREPIVSLQQAISRLGFTALCDIALAIALKSKVFHVAGHEDAIKKLWVHSAATGAWAKEIARLRRRNVEGAFLSGLLHDVGKPVIWQALLELQRKTDPLPDESLIEIWLDEFHTRVGGELLERWPLPKWMAEVVRWHHHPDLAGEHGEAAATACLADVLAHEFTTPTTEGMALLRRHPTLAALGLYADELDLLLERREQVALVTEAFA